MRTPALALPLLALSCMSIEPPDYGYRCSPDYPDCPTGYSCISEWCVRPDDVSMMYWKFTNDCYDDDIIQLRIFDIDTGARWPAKEENVFVMAPGDTATAEIGCKTGKTVCFGANQPNHDLYWGIGVFGDQACENCCAQCYNEMIEIPPLVCSSQ
jgi:hypothetical protein